MIRMLFPGFLAAILLYGSPAISEQKLAPVEVWKSPSCGCCSGWVKHMQSAGHAVKPHNVVQDVLYRIKRQAGIPEDLQSCHTAKIGGYVIEGHVPAQDITRLLSEKPDAVGLAVPDMPIGSPGMNFGPEKEPYDVLLVKKDGSTEVFAKH
ncbi:MAG: DUF411 domain-containing protein [Methyloligellaceae bacterium]